VTPAEVATVLAKCAAYDRRTVGRADVAAWHEILAPVELVDALPAVTAHYRQTSDWAMPADILDEAQAARRARRRRHGQRTEALALPSRFETDTDRTSRIRRGIAACRAAITRQTAA
jgi:hypothetical protein